MMFLSSRATRDERGSLAPSVAAMIIILFLLGGLIIDGARALGARSRAAAYAEEGARIAGQGVSFDQGTIELDERAIAANAGAYCDRIAASDDGVGQCSYAERDGDIVFTVDLTIDKGILGMVSDDPTMTFVGEGRAVAEIGITRAQGSAEDPPTISSGIIPGNDVDPRIEEAVGGGCPAPKTWEEATPGTSPTPFEYWELLDYYLQKPARCTIPPVCPNAGRLVRVPEKPYSKSPEEIDEALLREDEERWDDALTRCPTAEALLYTFTKKPTPTETETDTQSPDPTETDTQSPDPTETDTQSPDPTETAPTDDGDGTGGGS